MDFPNMTTWLNSGALWWNYKNRTFNIQPLFQFVWKDVKSKGRWDLQYVYLDGHVSHIGILRALHEDKRWVSSILYHHLVCYFTRSWGGSRENSLIPSYIWTSTPLRVYPILRAILITCGTSGKVMSWVLCSDGNMLTCTNHGDGGLYINPLICIDARVDKD